MKALLALALGWIGLTAVRAQDALLTLEWGARRAGVTDRVPVDLDGRRALRLENTNPTPWTVNLARLPAPPLEPRPYALRGEIRYEGVAGDGFLELWNQFAPAEPGGMAARYFSRTLGLSGPMGRISGTSDWRPFEVPFDPTGAPGAPTELEFNLHLPGPGRVWIGPVTLVQYRGRLAAAGSGWWPPQVTGGIGGAVGGTVGILAGIAGSLVSRGRARRFVMILFSVFIGLGIASLVGGVAAVVAGQPFHVTGTLFFIGVLLVAIIPTQLRVSSRRYAEWELRRMQAVDAR